MKPSEAERRRHARNARDRCSFRKKRGTEKFFSRCEAKLACFYVELKRRTTTFVDDGSRNLEAPSVLLGVLRQRDRHRGANGEGTGTSEKCLDKGQTLRHPREEGRGRRVVAYRSRTRSEGAVPARPCARARRSSRFR